MLINNGELDINPSNAKVFSYPNDILDGVYIDFGDNYSFISAHTEGYDGLLDALDDEGIESEVFDNPQSNDEPHCYVIKAVGQLMIRSLEDMLANE